MVVIQKEQLKNVGIVINGVDFNKKIGYGYSYGIESSKKTWLDKIKSRLSS